jgi:hypothetical protein
MDVMATARKIGLMGEDGSNVFGTIEQHVVLTALGELALDDIADADLFAAAVQRVNKGRSAGVERLGATNFLGRVSENGEIQLNYRAEMADIFMDLAIDIGLRHSAAPTPTSVV